MIKTRDEMERAIRKEMKLEDRRRGNVRMTSKEREIERKR
jgi:hypothetical protein